MDIQISNAFPADIIRLYFEAAIDPGSEDDQARQRTAYACSLVSKEVKSWVEPLLYRKVVLESNMQVVNFLRALELKSDVFLERVVKTAWILADLPEDADLDISLLFSKCRSLKSLAIRGTAPYMDVLCRIPAPISEPHALRELSIILPNTWFRRLFCTLNITLQKLQIIHFDPICTVFNDGLRNNRWLLGALQTTPQIYFDSTFRPSDLDIFTVQDEIIPFILLEPPKQNATLYIRYSSALRDPKYEIPLSHTVDPLNPEEWRFGHRIFVSTELHPELQRAIDTPELERAKAWISYRFDGRDEVSSNGNFPDGQGEGQV